MMQSLIPNNAKKNHLLLQVAYLDPNQMDQNPHFRSQKVGRKNGESIKRNGGLRPKTRIMVLLQAPRLKLPCTHHKGISQFLHTSLYIPLFIRRMAIFLPFVSLRDPSRKQLYIPSLGNSVPCSCFKGREAPTIFVYAFTSTLCYSFSACC